MALLVYPFAAQPITPADAVLIQCVTWLGRPSECLATCSGNPPRTSKSARRNLINAAAVGEGPFVELDSKHVACRQAFAAHISTALGGSSRHIRRRGRRERGPGTVDLGDDDARLRGPGVRGLSAARVAQSDLMTLYALLPNPRPTLHARA